MPITISMPAANMYINRMTTVDESALWFQFKPCHTPRWGFCCGNACTSDAARSSELYTLLFKQLDHLAHCLLRSNMSPLYCVGVTMDTLASVHEPRLCRKLFKVTTQSNKLCSSAKREVISSEVVSPVFLVCELILV